MEEKKPSTAQEAEKTPEVIPILPLFDAALFPKMVLPLMIMQEESVRLIDEAMSKDRIFGLLVSRHPSDDKYGPDDLYQFGTVALILKMAKTDENRTNLLVQGLRRFQVKEFIKTKPYLQAQVVHIEEVQKKDKEIEAHMANLINTFLRIVELSPGLPRELGPMAKSIQEPGTLADMVASTINSTLEEKQSVLETLDLKKRLKEVTRQANHQKEVLELGNKIQSQVKEDMDKQQKEYYLRQQLKAIRDELGEKDETNLEVEEYKTKINERGLPEEVKKEAGRELTRLSRMHPSSSEYTVSSTYLDWLTSLPWNQSTKEILDIRKATKVLDEDHFGLEKAKKRIIEYLAVRKLKPDSKGPILCFAGPPGTGKTS
ncbi:MAG: LON peptidase substrate-binding domain-containing protein, partial [Thermodesulfobacteriota bacterium]